MFSCITLLEAFALAADPADWEEFSRLRPADDGDFWVFTMGDGLSVRDREVVRYRELWAKFVEAMRSKLLAGEWVADGFNAQFGARPIPIDARLWRVLDIAPGHDEAEGEGFKFVNLSISEVRPVATRMDHVAKASLRHELVRWIETVGRASVEPRTADQVRDDGRRAFKGVTITDTMFREAWRAAKKPEHFVHAGRPKLKGREK